MYRLLIVEDEPSAIRQLQTLIHKYCKNFEVVGIAEDGQDGIWKAKELKPDMIITDIRMPLVDGIEFIRIMNRELPDVAFLITSGYSEFEYVQRAISYGVNDYLLKPIVPSEFVYSMEKVEAILGKKFYEKRNNILKKIAKESLNNPESIKKYFPYEKYYLSIVRVKGIPGRFEQESELEIYSEKDETVAVYGRDSNECLHLIPDEAVENSDIKMFTRKIIKQYTKMDAYYTCLYMTRPVTVEEFAETMEKLYRMLDQNIVIGKSQMLGDAEDMKAGHSERNVRDISLILKKVEYLIRKKEFDKLKKEVVCIFDQWEREECPQVFVEYMIKQMLFIAQKYNTGNMSYRQMETESILDEILAGSNHMKDVCSGFLDVLLQNLQQMPIEKVDAPEFMEKLKNYVEQHIAEEIFLVDICNTFGVSQPYFSKIFRKYMNKSFNQYITEQRIEKAKEIMRSNKDMLIKDVALSVGYGNQFYFSRIFHAYTNMSPTEYFNQC